MGRQILIGNNYNENMLADRSALTPEFVNLVALIAQRMAWFAQAGDILVLPRDLSPEMKAYIVKLKKGVSQWHVRVVVPQANASDVKPIGAEELFAPEFLARLRAAIGTDEYHLVPYYYDRAAARLAHVLNLREDAAPVRYMREGGAELLNDKRAFRCLAASRGVALAAGEVCTSCDEFSRAVHRLLDRTGAVIAKQNQNAGAAGNIVIGHSVQANAQGARQVIEVTGSCGIGAAIARAWSALEYSDHPILIVEVYHPVRSILYAEFRIDAVRRSTSLLNWGQQRMEPTFKGFIIPPATSAVDTARFVSGATELARVTCDLGFDGLMDVDGIVTTTGEIIFNEVNGRAGACSHIHHIAEELLGDDYALNSAICAHVGVKAPSFPMVIHALADHELQFCPEKRTGIVVTAEDTLQLGVLEFISIGHTHDEAARLAADFERVLTVNA